MAAIEFSADYRTLLLNPIVADKEYFVSAQIGLNGSNGLASDPNASWDSMP